MAEDLEEKYRLQRAELENVPKAVGSAVNAVVAPVKEGVAILKDRRDAYFAKEKAGLPVEVPETAKPAAPSTNVAPDGYEYTTPVGIALNSIRNRGPMLKSVPPGTETYTDDYFTPEKDNAGPLPTNGVNPAQSNAVASVNTAGQGKTPGSALFYKGNDVRKFIADSIDEYNMGGLRTSARMGMFRGMPEGSIANQYLEANPSEAIAPAPAAPPVDPNEGIPPMDPAKLRGVMQVKQNHRGTFTDEDIQKYEGIDTVPSGAGYVKNAETGEVSTTYPGATNPTMRVRESLQKSLNETLQPADQQYNSYLSKFDKGGGTKPLDFKTFSSGISKRRDSFYNIIQGLDGKGEKGAEDDAQGMLLNLAIKGAEAEQSANASLQKVQANLFAKLDKYSENPSFYKKEIEATKELLSALPQNYQNAAMTAASGTIDDKERNALEGSKHGLDVEKFTAGKPKREADVGGVLATTAETKAKADKTKKETDAAPGTFEQALQLGEVLNPEKAQNDNALRIAAVEKVPVMEQDPKGGTRQAIDFDTGEPKTEKVFNQKLYEDLSRKQGIEEGDKKKRASAIAPPEPVKAKRKFTFDEFYARATRAKSEKTKDQLQEIYNINNGMF